MTSRHKKKARNVKSTVNRRQFLRYSGALGATGAIGPGLLGLQSGCQPQSRPTTVLPFENGARPMVQFPEKRPLMQLTARPVQLETPFSVFDGDILTPNDAHYVRYHNAFMFGHEPVGPQSIDEKTFTIHVEGNVTTPLTLTVADLKANFQQREIIAVNQCSGNSRGFFTPRVRGGQWANGAMANARWTGVALSDVLNAAGVGSSALQVVFNGLDEAHVGHHNDAHAEGGTPDFEKAIDMPLAMNGEVMLAYAMNGEELPMLNGFPVRVVVPGYYATYWVKHVNHITVVDVPNTSFYMQQAYRIPDNACACVPAGTTPTSTVPIGKLNVRSFITNLTDGQKLSYFSQMMFGTTVSGIAFDGGSGIAKVEFSHDGGANWRTARLGADHGKYSFRKWQISLSPVPFLPLPAGTHKLMVRATSNSGETQPMEPRWNPSGYMRNNVESITISIG